MEYTLKALSRRYQSNNEFANEVNLYTSFLNNDATPLQRVWHYKYQDNEPKLCTCGKHRKFVRIKYYHQTCGERKCWSALITQVRKPPLIQPKPNIEAMRTGFLNKVECMSIQQLKELPNDKLGKAIRQSEKIKSIVYQLIPKEITIQLAVVLFKENKKPSICSCGNYITKIRLNTCGTKKCKNLIRNNTNQEKYGVSNISQSRYYLDIKKSKRISKYSKLVEPDELIDSDGYFMNCKCNKDHVYEISQHLVRQRQSQDITLCTICNPIGSFKNSAPQKAVFTYLKNIGIDAKLSDRTLIKPLELDILIKSKKIAIEFNGLYFHSDVFKKDNYHIEKSKLVADKGYSLIHIWEDDWIERKEIVMSMLAHKLQLNNSTKIDARKCTIYIPDINEVNTFMLDNHLQGTCPSSVKIALKYSDEIIAMMTFGKPRIALGGKGNGWELLRFCNKLNHHVRGGASKMFTYFLSKYKGDIYSYSDNSRNSGGVYKALGFIKTSDGSPNYWYMNSSKLRREHRYTYRKDVLVAQGFDASKTERDIMAERKYYRIYDCGSSKWEYKRKA